MIGDVAELLVKSGAVIAGLNFENFGFTSLEWPLFTAGILAMFYTFTALTRLPWLWETLANRIEVRGKRLEDDELNMYDYGFVFINEMITIPYVMTLTWALRGADWMLWDASEVGFVNCLLVVPLCLGAYDLVYVLFHRTLHIPAIYPYIHKHHHRQAVPFRGTFDGINTHPIEFTFGEFLHLGALLMVKALLGLFGFKVHWYGAATFLIIAGFMASLNHTRFAVRIPGVFDVRDHDVHHRWPRSNYGQFVMWWDMMAGTFKPYSSTKGVDKSMGVRGVEHNKKKL